MLKILLIAILTYYSSVNISYANEALKIEKNEITSPTENQQKISQEAKDILKKIYDKKIKERKTNKQQKINIEHFNYELINKNGYEALSGDKGIDIVIKKPGEKLTKKIEMYQDAFLEKENKKYEAAIVKFEKIIDVYPSDKIALSGLATSYHKLGEYDIANEYYIKILNLYPDDQKTINNFLTLLAEEAPKESLKELLKLDKIIQKNDVLKAQISSLFFADENYEEALNYIQYAIIINENNIVYHYNKAIILKKLGLYKQANDIFKKIISSKNYKSAEISLEKLKKQLN
jgi:tetratricopeptide (TPR) repeat protein